MHLTSEDKRAARDGFAYVVLVGGKRKCYCTKHSEAKAEAGKSGKIVSLGRMRYTTQNPHKRANPKRRYVVAYGGGDTAPLGAFASKAEAKAAMLDKVARGKLVGGYVTLEKPKYRNPAASIQDPKYAAVRDAIGLANYHSKEWGKLVMLGNKEYGGDPYKFVSGGGQEHWPRQLMNEINRELRAYQDAQHEAFAAFKKIHPRMNHRSKLWQEFAETAIPAGGYGFGKRRNPWEAKRPATRYGVTVTNPRKYKHGKAAQLERLILRVSAHGKLTETQLQEILQGIRRAYPAGSKATAQKRIAGLIAKAKEQRIWPKVYNRLARL